MIKKIVGFSFLILLLSAPVFAQEVVPVKKTQRTEVIDGKRFYIHKVEKGQTAYSISKAYGVSLEELYKYNPGAENGLQLDQELKIPFEVKKIAETNPVYKDSISADGRFVFHSVQRGETLYRIMKNYNVDQETLLRYNPALTANLHPGDIIKIPTNDQMISEKAQGLYADLIEYKVKKKDTYYRLQKKFGVNQKQLEQLNPSLKTTGLQKGIIILMPAGLKKLDSIPQYQEITMDTVKLTADSLLSDSSLVRVFNCDTLLSRNDTFRIALMMPFFSEDEAEIRTINAYYTKEAKAYRSFTFIQFYEGFLMALDSLQKKGFNAEVYVYDTKNDTAEVRAITQKPEFAKLDLIIGPLFTRNLKIVLDAVRDKHTVVVSPFSRESSLVPDNPLLFKLAPNNKSLVESSCQWISDSLPDSRLLILHDNTELSKDMLALIQKNIALHAGHGIDTNNVFVFSYTTDVVDKMTHKLAQDQKNVVINLVNNEAVVSELLRKMNFYSEKHYDIYFMGAEWYWKRYKTLETSYLVNMHLTLCSSYFIDTQDTIVQEFERKFVEKYKTLPNEFAYTAFDISWYFMNALYYYGPGFETCLRKLPVHTMHTDFIFVQPQFGSAYENSYLNIYQYNNYKLIPKQKR